MNDGCDQPVVLTYPRPTRRRPTLGFAPFPERLAERCPAVRPACFRPYLQRYDQAKRRIEAFLDLPDATFDLMMGFLRQNGGRFSQRARTREFAKLTDEEVVSIEGVYADSLLLPIDEKAGAEGASIAAPKES